MWACAAHSRASLKLDTISRFGLRKNDPLGTRQLFKSPHDPLESTAKTCQFVMWACAAHSRGYFSFTRKVSKSVSKGLPLRYPLRLKIFQNLLKNGTTVPFLGTMARNFIFPQSITLSCPHSHFVTFPLIYHESFMLLRGDRRGQRPLLPEIQKPEGFWCVFGNFLHTRKLPRCGARSSTKKRVC